MKDIFEINTDKARIAELEKGIDELLNQVNVMKRYITDIAKAIADRYDDEVNTFLDPYNEDYVKDIIDMIHCM